MADQQQLLNILAQVHKMSNTEATNALTMKLLALSSAVEGSRQVEIKEAIAALPGAFFAERENAEAEIKRLKEENELLKQRLAQEVLVNSGRLVPAPAPAPPPMSSVPVAPKNISNSRQGVGEGRRLHIGNLSHSTTERDLEDFFRGFDINGIDLIPHPHKPGGALGYGFVNIATAAEAQRAIQVLDGRTLLDRRINVQLAKGDQHSLPSSSERENRFSNPQLDNTISRDPRRLTPPTSIRAGVEGPPLKRQRSDSVSSLGLRRVRCVGCFQMGAQCDGQPVCSACKGRNYGCEYNECWDLLGCSDMRCTRLHPEQWDRNEQPRRKVKSWKP